MKARDVDSAIAQWRVALSDVDPSPLAVVGRLSQISRMLEQEFGAQLGRFGLNEGEFDVVCALRRIGSPYQLSPRELASSVLISAGGLTKRLDNLEHRGYVVRTPSPTDGRSVIVTLTAAGKRITDRAVRAHFKDEERLLTRLSARDRVRLAALLDRILN